ncbi:MAG: Deoxycytidine triphosphate deaminase [Candidatus Amesbacteria bacterium GW2011_GWA1_48_9]|uniref:Deoxycytidine triphosphate deaminase n=1 Tax=Candidatus Amesbacteria bacterium GW2011_GWA1_48_9 TaxID=1618355 RepID=A0A0G1Y2X2_9BACT|nr:MAG: Deoxycytidine triphosphate deaminase [Candidatus Amesbacteria bacterium GW2011_GWA1_48_9]
MSGVEARNWRDLYGFLPDWAIVNMIREEIIGIDPLNGRWEEDMGTVSVDFHLGKRVRTSKSTDSIDVKVGVKSGEYDLVELSKGDVYIFSPTVLAIAEVQEHLTLPNDVIAFVEGKSSLARLGLVVHLTAGRFDPGWDGTPVMEFLNNGSREIIVPYGWPICAFTFYRMMSNVDRPYSRRGRYFGVNDIHSLVQKEGINGERLVGNKKKSI